jgi:glycosyltransferase involved in cell wall biosynthesis
MGNRRGAIERAGFPPLSRAAAARKHQRAEQPQEPTQDERIVHVSRNHIVAEKRCPGQHTIPIRGRLSPNTGGRIVGSVPEAPRESDKVDPGVIRTVGLISVCAPVFDEEELVEAFYDRATEALRSWDYELIVVNDGSSDGTAAILDRLADGDERLRVVHLSRNFGHQAALTAGLEHARGDVVAMLDADLQDPPELISDMVALWERGSDVVYAVREARAGETRFKLATARWFYRLFDRLAQVDLEPDSGDFRLLDRRALDALLSMKERSRFLRGMTVWVGFTQSAISYERDVRYAGETKFSLNKMLRFSLDAISSFSHVPLQLATLLGFFFSGVAFLAIPVVIGLRLAGSYLPGFGAVTIAVLMLGGIQLIAIGLIGEYVGRIYDEVKGRPLYVVADRRNEPDGPA